MVHLEILFYMFKVKSNPSKMVFIIHQHLQQKDLYMILSSSQEDKDQLLLWHYNIQFL
jgi:hypothetical protein